MKKQKRLKAVQQFYDGEKPDEICASLGCSRSWLYKWASRFTPDDPAWFEDRSRRPSKSLAFEYRHNSAYRYSKIKGKTPLTALAEKKAKLIFPSKNDAPKHPLEKPEEGCYHLVRFIRRDCRLNIFGELFPAPPQTQYE